jgi:hypothetical protein
LDNKDYPWTDGISIVLWLGHKDQEGRIMDFSNWHEALYLIVGTIGLLISIYLIVGFSVTLSFKKEIRKKWESNGEHSIFWPYLVGVLFWPRVDWYSLEEMNNAKEETSNLHLRRGRGNSRHTNSRGG